LMTNHEPDVALAVADDALLMAAGAAPQFGSVDQVLTADALSRLYQLPIRLIEVDGRKRVLWT
jgi:iron complex transport system ATP-binding protein